jgi:hypothetical protein
MIVGATGLKAVLLALVVAGMVGHASADTAPTAQAAMDAKLKACGRDWADLRKTGQTAGQTFTGFLTGCLVRDNRAENDTPRPAVVAVASVAPDMPAGSAAAPVRERTAPRPVAGRVADDEIARCKAGWKEHRTAANVSGLKAWHAWMAQCLP